MRHLTLPRFWKYYQELPEEMKKLADKNYEILITNPFHPSLHFKKVGTNRHYGQLEFEKAIERGAEKSEGIVWFWIGTHEDYDKILAHQNLLCEFSSLELPS